MHVFDCWWTSVIDIVNVDLHAAPYVSIGWYVTILTALL